MDTPPFANTIVFRVIVAFAPSLLRPNRITPIEPVDRLRHTGCEWFQRRMGSEVKNTRMRWDVQLQATVLHYNPIQTGRDQATSITDVFELIQYIAQVL